MKTLFTSLILLSVYLQSFSQVFTLHQMPTGYTAAQLRVRNGIALDQNNNYWVAFDKIGLGKFDGTAWTMYDTTNSGIADNKITEVIIDNLNRVIASTGKGLVVFDGIIWQNFDNSNSPLPASGATTVAKNGNDTWVGTEEGIYKHDGTVWTSYNTGSGLVNDSVTCISFAPDNSLWIGTRKGISHFDGSIWTNYSIANGLLANDTIESIAVNGNSEPWYTTPRSDCYYLNSASGSFENLVSVLPSVTTGCYDFNTTVASEVISADSSVFFITNQPVPVVTGSSHILIQVDAQNNIFYSEVTPGFYQTALPLQIIYNGTDYASLSTWTVHQSTPSFYSGSVALSSFTRLEADYIAHDFLDINNVNTLLLNRGDMHWDPVGQTNYYNIPACSNTNTVYSSAIWLGGYDSNNILHTAGQTYRQSGANDFWTGPLDTTNATTDSTTIAQYDRLWKLNRTTLNDFIYNYQQGNVTNGTYIVPEVILNWPAHGSGNYSRDLAPFYDNNNDGNYNPYDGDYPEMTGDQQLWWIFNDAFGPHTETQGPAFGFEIHGKAYAFNCDSLTGLNEPINYTTFYQYKIINRTSEIYHDMYIGLWTDNDLGNAADDYVGCNVPLNSGICYNGDIDDEGANGYGLKPPYQDITILKGPKTDGPDGLDNNHNGVIDETDETHGMSHFHYYISINNAPNSNPSATQDYYDYLNSTWLDGLPVTYGSNGLDPGNPPCNYMFPGTSDPAFPGQNWTMPIAGMQKDDVRYIMSSGKFTIGPGESRTIDFAYIYSRDTVGNWPTDAEAKNLADINKVTWWFNNNLLSSCPPAVTSVNEIKNNTATISVYPVPAKNLLSIDASLKGDFVFSIYDVTGKACINDHLKGNSIDISKLDAGSYQLKLFNDTEIYTVKFVKL